MSYQPLISKIRCHNPNKKGSKHANRTNLHYIATREGVDLSVIESSPDDGIADNITFKKASDSVYTRYMATRPRSHGLMGNIDTKDLEQVERHIYQLSKQGRNIYRGITSLGESDAQALGLTNADAWYRKMNALMPDIARELGLSSTNFSWVGAFHAEPTHPHFHYQLWDNDEKIKSPYIHISVQNRCRILQEKSFFSPEYEHTLQAVFESEREELYSLKNSSRQTITDYFKDIMNIKYVPGLQTSEIPPKFTHKDAEVLTKYLENLQSVLPLEGRMNYQFMPREVKKEIDKISDFIFKRPEMKQALSSYIQAADQIHQIKGSSSDRESYRKKMKSDIYKRTGNIILKSLMNSSPTTHSESNHLPDFPDKQLLEQLELSAEQGHAGAQYALGKFYFSTDNLEYQDIPKGLQLIKNSAEQGNLLAQKYISEIGNSEQTSRMIKAGNYMLAWDDLYKSATTALYDEHDFASAIELFKQSATQGNVLAYAELGKIYQRGIGCEVNEETAVEYFNESFKGFVLLEKHYPRNTYIKYRIGKFYAAGNGTEMDIHAARKYFQRAPENKYAQYSLAKLYLQNLDAFDETPAELIETSKILLQFSADQDMPYAAYDYAQLNESSPELCNKYYKQAHDTFLEISKNRQDDVIFYRIGKMYFEGKGIKADIKQAIKYWERSASLNNIYAQLALSKIYLSAEYPEYHDIPKALTLLSELAKQKNDSALYNLGHFYLSEDFPEYQDIPKAIQLLDASAEQSNQFAQYALGKFFLSEEHPEYQDIPKAIQLLDASAEQGNQFAQYFLGSIYLYGKYGITADVERGKNLLTLSAEQGNLYAAQSLYYYEQMPSFGYAFTCHLYHSIFNSMVQDSQRKEQELSDAQSSQSKQAQKEKKRQEEISHL